MKQGIGAVLFLAVMLGGCAQQTDALDGPGAETSRISMEAGQADCTTVAWEVGMEYLDDEEALKTAGSCDSYFHFRTTKDRFYGAWTTELMELGMKVENERSESRNVRYQNPRLGYLEFDASLSFDAETEDEALRDNQLRYDTASGRIHSITMKGRNLKECGRLVELFTKTESRLCGDNRMQVYTEDLEDWYHSPFVQKELGWPGEAMNGFGINGYAVDLSYRLIDDRCAVRLSPSFDRDHGRLLSQSEAETSGEACSKFTHFDVTVDRLASKAADQLADLGYKVGDETDWSYNYIYEIGPNDIGKRPGEYACYDSRRLWALDKDGLGEDFFWLEIDWDTAEKTAHSISAVLKSREECYDLCSALLSAEAEAGGDDSLKKSAGEWMSEMADSYGYEYIYVNGAHKKYAATVTNGYRDNDTYRIEIKPY